MARKLRPRHGCAWSLLLLASCANVAERQEREQDSFQAELGQRLELESLPPGLSADSPELQAWLREQLQVPLDQNAALRIALVNQARVGQVYERLALAVSDAVQGGLLSNPVLSADARLFDAGTEFEFGLVQPFLDLLHLSLRRRVAQADFEVARAELGEQLVLLAFDTRRALLELRAAQQQEELAQAQQVAASAGLEVELALHAAGNRTDLERSRAELAALDARLAWLEAQSDTQVAREALSRRLGLAAGQTFELAPELPAQARAMPELDVLEAQALGASFAMERARARSKREAESLGLAKRLRWLPDGRAGLVALGDVDQEWGVGPSVELALPVFDQGDARVAHAAAMLRTELSEARALGLEIPSLVRERFALLRSLDQRCALMGEQRARIGARAVVESLQQFNAMQVGAFDVLRERQLELEALRRAAELEHQRDLAELELEELLAGAMRSRPALALQALPRALESSSTRTGH